MRAVVVVMTVFLLVGCMQHDLQVYAPIDHNEKTVTVPPGSSGLIGDLKKVLQNEGWQMLVSRGPVVTEGRLGESTRLEQYGTFRSRYRLAATSSRYDICLNLSPAIVYDITFIDNKTGSEAFTLSGKGCQNSVLEKFQGALRGVQN